MSSEMSISCLIDTDIVIDYLRRREYAKELLERFYREGMLAISVVTHLEVYQGMKPGEEERTNTFLDGFSSVPVNVFLARKAGKLLSELRARGITIGMADAIIGATALSLNVPLLTNNAEHYPFSGLQLIKGMT